MLQLDVDELEETQEFYDDEGEFQEDEDENVQRARMSLASIFGETEVVEVDEAQQDESLLVRLCALFCFLSMRLHQATIMSLVADILGTD